MERNKLRHALQKLWRSQCSQRRVLSHSPNFVTALLSRIASGFEDQPLDPGKLQQIEANLSLRHTLVLAQPRRKHGHRLRPPVQLMGPEIEANHLVIAQGISRASYRSSGAGPEIQVGRHCGALLGASRFSGFAFCHASSARRDFKRSGRLLMYSSTNFLSAPNCRRQGLDSWV